MSDEPEERWLYLCHGCYWPSKEDADNLTNQVSWKDLGELPWKSMSVRIYRPKQWKTEQP